MRRHLSTRTLALTLVCLIVAAFAVAQTLPISNSNSTTAPTPTPPSQTTGAKAFRRNLAEYAALGPLNLRDEVTPSARRQVISQLRSFLWQKWQGKQKGKVSYVSTLIRGYAPGTTQFFVEPDERGEWRIALEVQGQDAPQYFYSVEEVSVDADGLPIEAGMPHATGAKRLVVLG